MTATERLRELLDERGVEHVDAEDGHTQHTWWSDGDHEIAASNSGERLAVYNLTPEQAIAATLGAGTCCDEGTFSSWRLFTCSHCSVVFPIDAIRDAPIIGRVIPPKFCPNCGRKVVDE